MTVASRGWSRLTVPGRLILIVLPVLLAVTIALVALAPVLGPLLGAVIGDNLPFARFLLAATAVLLLAVPIAFLNIYMEMKVIALMNLRVGPDRVGPFGSLMSVNHGLKVLVKEDFTPTGADRLVFTWAPVITFLASVMTLMVIPFAPGLFGQDFNIGLLYFFAMSGIGVVGLLMAGWASFNKYSLIGGLRAAAQAISYEIPLTLSVVGLIILAGTMSLNQIVLMQSGSILDWNVWRQPLGFVIFFIAATAEANRPPFDLTEADSEIVAGYATEYSGMRFGFLFFAEYVNMFIVSALAVTLFFGGWTAPFDWPIPLTVSLDPGGLGIWLLVGLLVVPPLLIVGLAAPFWMLDSRMGFAKALLIGFLLFNVIAVAAVLGLAFVSFDWIVGALWFFLKTYVLVFTFVWMRATLPRVRIDQLMGFAWKWLTPAALLNLFVTATAVVIIASTKGAP